MRSVHCQKLKKDLPGLARIPYPGELGQRIYEHISQEAWGLWLKQQTMLINENRLNLLSPQAKTFLEAEMQKFLFEGEDNKPAGYTPEDK